MVRLQKNQNILEFYQEFLISHKNQKLCGPTRKLKKNKLHDFYTVKTLFKQKSSLNIIEKLKKLLFRPSINCHIP